MKKIIRIVLTFLIFNSSFLITSAQISINEDGSSPDASAMLDIKSTDKGILIPRMDSTNRNNISNPATGLMIDDTDNNSFWYYNGTSWTEVGSAAFISENGLTQSVNNDDDFVFGADSLNYGIGTETKFFLDKSNGAFRVGAVSGGNWDDATVGDYSFASGYNTLASGYYSTALGSSTEATGDFSTAFGYSTKATDSYATAFGSFTEATEDFSTAFGNSTEASANYATAFGASSKATAAFSTAFGSGTEANGYYSTALGSNTEANGQHSIASGYFTTAASYGETAFGLYNTYTPVSASSFDDADRLFVIGNGTADNARSDAFVVHKNGDISLNGALTIDSFYTFPTTDGNTSQILTTDGNGTLSWTTQNDTLLTDADGDTKIQLEESSDEDIIRFDMNGTEFMRLDSGRIEILNTGNSIFIGEGAGDSDDYTDNDNIFIGHQSGSGNTEGDKNTFIGSQSGYSNNYGYNNVLMGYQSGYNNNGNENVFIGYQSGYDNTSGENNTFIGYESGYDNTTGQDNTFIGRRAGYNNEIGEGNIFIGYSAGYNETGSNKPYIENSSATTPLIYGEFDNDLLQINGSLSVTDKITTNSNWISGDGDDEGIFINSDGNIGIGTTSPTQGKLVISGTGATQSFSGGTYGYYSYNGWQYNLSSLSNSYAIYTDDRIAALVYHAISDERVKNIQGISDNAADLETLKKIKITDYQFKDKIKNGDITQKKVIAQQVKEVYPQAVTTNTTETIPDIMQSAMMDENGWVVFNDELGMTNDELKVGDKVQIIFDNRKELLEILETKKNTFRVKLVPKLQDNTQPETIFVYGRQVNDFHTVDYEAISMLNVSATQQLAKENEQLKQRVIELESQLEKINQLEVMLQQLQAQLENQ